MNPWYRIQRAGVRTLGGLLGRRALGEEAVRNDDGTDERDPDGGGGAVANESPTPNAESCLDDRLWRLWRDGWHQRCLWRFEGDSACPRFRSGGHMAGDTVAEVRRIEIESNFGHFVMDAVVLDLISTKLGDERNAREQAVDRVVLDVGEPVRSLEHEIVEHGTEQKYDERLRFDDEDECGVVDEKKYRKDPEPAGDVFEIVDIPRLEVRPLKNTVMVEMIPSNVGQIRKTAVHRYAVKPMLNELRVEGAGEEPGDARQRKCNRGDSVPVNPGDENQRGQSR